LLEKLKNILFTDPSAEILNIIFFYEYNVEFYKNLLEIEIISDFKEIIYTE